MRIRIVERDKKIMREIDRWRVCLGRHIRELAGFSGQRACDRRLRKLIEAGYIERKHILYGVPAIYSVTKMGKKLAGIEPSNSKLKIEQIGHDITVLDTAIYLHKGIGILFEDITTEKELHSQDGFGIRKHRPDFIYGKDNETIFEEIIKTNFMKYDRQIWIVPDSKCKIANILKANKAKYPNIEIKEIKEIEGHD